MSDTSDSSSAPWKTILSIALGIATLSISYFVIAYFKKQWQEEEILLDEVAEPTFFEKRKASRRRGVPVEPKWSPKKTIIAGAAIAVLMFAISYLHLDQFFMTSILNDSQKNAIVALAKSKEGSTYVYGSTGLITFDCSGFTGYVVKEALGVVLPRTSKEQYSVGREIEFKNLGVGDLVFFNTSGSGISHVGIVTERKGSDVYMTHANSYNGKVMKEKISGYWLEQGRYVGAREITNATKDIKAPSTPDPTFTGTDKGQPDQYDDNFPPSEPEVVVGTTTSVSKPTVTTTETKPAVTVTETKPPVEKPVAKPPVTTTETDEVTDEFPDPATVTPEVKPDVPPSVPTGFSDVPESHAHATAINYLKSKKIIGGYPDGSFGPDRPITRAEILKIGLNGAGANTKGYQDKDVPFTDVEKENSLFQYMAYAKSQKISNGYPDGTFKPNNSTTRGEAAKLVLKMFGIRDPEEPSGDPYLDVSKDLDLAPFIEYVRVKKLLDILGGNFKISQNITRGEVAEIMYRLLVLKKTKADVYTSDLKIR